MYRTPTDLLQLWAQLVLVFHCGSVVATYFRLRLQDVEHCHEPVYFEESSAPWIEDKVFLDPIID